MSSVTAKGLHQVVMMIRIPSEYQEELFSVLSENCLVKLDTITQIPFEQDDTPFTLLLFSCSNSTSEILRKLLIEHGVGIPGSISDVNVLSLAVNKDLRSEVGDEEDTESEEEGSDSDQNKKHEPAAEESQPSSAFLAFQTSIKARIAVENLLETIDSGASFTFDFIVLVIVASVIAVVGLITNSSVIIVASMLVSPMMGPILGFTFGSVVQDLDLVLTGLKSEALALLACILVGFLGGLAAAPISMVSAAWPTPEMESRATFSSLYV